MSKWLLLAMFFVGILLSLLGSGINTSLNFAGGVNQFGTKVLVTVNGHAITEDEFSLAKHKNENSTDNELLALMVDNILLLQRAQELGLLQSDRVVRKAIVHKVVEHRVKQVLDQDTPSQALHDFYNNNLAMFSTNKQYQVQVASFPEKTHCQDKDLMSKQWQNHLVQQPLARGLHSEILVYRQLGEGLAKLVTQLNPGELSAPIPTEQGCIVLQLSESKPSQILPFEQVNVQVLAQYRVKARRQALEELLITLRTQADIRIADDIAKTLIAKALIANALAEPLTDQTTKPMAENNVEVTANE